MGKRLGGDNFDLPVTDHVGSSLVRMPFYLMSDEELDFACLTFKEIITTVLAEI